MTLTLTSASGIAVWARAGIGMKVKYRTESPKYVTKSVNVSAYNLRRRPDCTNNSFTGTIISKLGQYTDGEDLIIHCQIFVNELDNPVHVVKKSEVEDNNMSSRFDLSKLMEDARHNDRYTDVTLVTEGKQFKAHKVVLASWSPFFATHFGQEMVAMKSTC